MDSSMLRNTGRCLYTFIMQCYQGSIWLAFSLNIQTHFMWSTCRKYWDVLPVALQINNSLLQQMNRKETLGLWGEKWKNVVKTLHFAAWLVWLVTQVQITTLCDVCSFAFIFTKHVTVNSDFYLIFLSWPLSKCYIIKKYFRWHITLIGYGMQAINSIVNK